MMRVHEMKKLIIPFLVTLLMPFGISYCWGQAQVAADSSSSQYSGVVERGKAGLLSSPVCNRDRVIEVESISVDGS